MKTTKAGALSTGGLARLAETSPSKIRNLVREGVLQPTILSNGRFVFEVEDARVVREHDGKGRRKQR
jgi:DNA-binding transcriptional MerR regulator